MSPLPRGYTRGRGDAWPAAAITRGVAIARGVVRTAGQVIKRGSATRIGRVVIPGAGAAAAGAAGGRVVRAARERFERKKTYRRMNPGNARAVKRAVRRLVGFTKLAADVQRALGAIIKRKPRRT